MRCRRRKKNQRNAPHGCDDVFDEAFDRAFRDAFQDEFDDRSNNAFDDATQGASVARSESHTRPVALLLALVALAGCGANLDTGSEQGDGVGARLAAQGSDTVIRATQSELIGAAPKRTRTIAAMMFNISGGAPNQTTITNLILGTGTSLKHMYNEISFGMQDIEADILGPFTLPVANCLTIACCGPSSDRTGNGATVQGLINGFPKKYDHYFYVYGAIPAGADCGTWGDEGNANRPAVYSSYSFHGIVGYAQELGHNFGMTHEATMTCTGQKPILDDPGQCNHVEYGSLISFMGQGGSSAYHPSAYHKYQQGWISKCNAVKVGGSGSYRLVPQELACNGVQLLQIPAPKSRAAPSGGRGTLNTYYLEMRGTYGFDKLKPQVIVSIGGAFPTMTQPAPYLYMLDMTPEASRADHTNAGLMTVGQSFEDPAGGLTITLTAIDAGSATVMVTSNATGSDTCSDATPFTAPGPDATSCTGVTGIVDGGVSATGGAGGSGTGGRAGTGGGGAGGRAAGTGGSMGGTGGAVVGSGGSAAGTGGGAAGTGGRMGTGGAAVTGTGGSAIVATCGASAGTGGPPGTGTGGTLSGTGGATTGTTGGQGVPGAGTGEVAGGCGCSASPTAGSTAGLFSFLSVLAVAALFGRRRSKRARG